MSIEDDNAQVGHAGAVITWGEALLRGSRALRRRGTTATPDLDAAILLGHVVGANRASLLAYPERQLDAALADAYDALLARRLEGEPVAYLIGHREFMGLDLLTDARALIPRPETEHLVEAALRYVRARLDRGEAPLIADIGTGSGAIAISLAAIEPRLPHIYATDVSSEALALAAENAQRLGVAPRVTFVCGDLLSALPEPVDLVLANLPYVAPHDAAALQPDVASFEPSLALYGEQDGLGHFRRFFAAAPEYVRPGGALMLEFGFEQRHALEALVHKHFPRAARCVIADYAGWDRVLVVETSAS